MKRRQLITLLAGAPVAWSAPTMAQQPDKVFRIGWLSASSAPRRGNPVIDGLRQGLHKLGYVEERNLIIEYRKADGHAERLPELAAELARLPVDLIIAIGAEAALEAALQATDSIPILMMAVDYDPLAKGFIDSLARPSGNITGMFFMQAQLMGKRLELLKTALPQLSRVVALHDSYTANQVPATASAAESLGLELSALELSTPPYDFDQAMAAALDREAQALIVLSSPAFFGQRQQAGAATVKYKLPAMFNFGYYAKAGGLMTYGVNLPDMFRYIAATHVDKILRGANPADLPVEQPTQFDLVINLKTAKALGLTLPPSILLQATEVIE